MDNKMLPPLQKSTMRYPETNPFAWIALLKGHPMFKPRLSFSLIALFLCLPVQAQEIVRVHPPFAYPQTYVCTSHWGGQLKSLGDDLGTDCFVERLVTQDQRTWMMAYRDQGLANADWYTWEEPVLAPFDGKVIRRNINPIVNQPGQMGSGPASFLIFERVDGVRVLIAHLRQMRVTVGESVTAGQVIGIVGNNGYSRHPHIHLGAWRGEMPVQLHLDQSQPEASRQQ